MKIYDAVAHALNPYKKLRDIHVNNLINASNILDSGAGTGSVTLELLKAGKGVTAIDNNEIALQLLKQKCRNYSDNLEVIYQDAQKIQFKDGTFDGISSMLVLPYLDRPEDYLREHVRVLRKNGIFVVSGVTHGRDITEVLSKYEADLEKTGKIKEIAKEFRIFKELVLENVGDIIKNEYSTDDAKQLFEKLNLVVINSQPNPCHYGNGYVLTLKKL